MRATTRDDGSIELVMTSDEASKLVRDEMFDDADTFAVTSKLRDVVQAELDANLLDDEDEDLDEDDEDEEIEGLDERIKGEEIEGID